jgi:glucosamine--fructose-6-phosphate aminotransferase (isomerizing)
VTSLLTSEIAEQPDVLARLLDAHLPRLAAWRAALRVGEVDGIVLVARGSSDNAARYAQYLWALRTGLPVGLATPSLHTVYGGRLDFRGKAVVALSQSGASPDVVAVLAAARDQGAPAVAVTNDPSSPLAGAATDVLDLDAGSERSVAATKTYTSSVLAVAVLGVALADPGEESAYIAELRGVPAAAAAAIELTTGLDEAAAVLAAPRRGVVVGRGLNLGTAYEAALKLTELTGSLMAPYSPADLMHGPVAALGPDVPVLALVPDEPASASVLDLAREAHRRESPLIALGPERMVADAPGTIVVLPAAADVAPWLTPVPAVIPAQLLAQRVAEARGVEVDQPGGLSKVTRTT